ncbi:hypothetical protein [Ruminococcus flavefaciens]|uniref:hypothetical protein n=1 Tax=Ruminococcus flavefaciens TaxID=1265 RepID=UPI0026EBBC88|nr:hypothetical protein [Ruminococcus flavefaciens]
MTKKRVLIIIVGIVIAVFGIWNAVWFWYYHSVKKYVVNIPDDGFGTYVINDAAENSYSFKFPNYLQFMSNMALIDKDDNALIVWTPFIGEKSYGVQICLEHREMYEMLLDKDGNLIPEKNLSDAPEVYNANIDVIKQLYKDASDFWKDDFY